MRNISRDPTGCLESIIVVTPMETIKTRLIDSGKGLGDGVRHVVQKDGVRGLYKGLFPTMAKSCSNQVGLTPNPDAPHLDLQFNHVLPGTPICHIQ